jgi:hypothetical protein
MRRWLVVTFLATMAPACATPNVVETALHGDLPALKREIRVGQKQGELSRRMVEHLAVAVAGRELTSSSGQTAVARVEELRMCAWPLTSELQHRAETLDAAGARATLVLYEEKKLDADTLVERYRTASSGAWRAVAARAAKAGKYALLRRRFFRDPDERVRHAALSAALEARDPDDLGSLLEAARLDPDAMNRSLAARAAGAIGGQRAVLAIKDLWANADQSARIALLDAWAMPAAYPSGGRREITRVAESRSSLPAVAAAGALLRQGGADAELGTTLLTSEVAQGTDAERRLAIRLVPVTDVEARHALEKAAEGQDVEVRVMALARLVESADGRQKAVGGLRKLAQGHDGVAVQARAALAAAADRSVTAELVAQLGSKNAEERRLAAIGLIRLGNYARAATALGDDDPRVRTEVACSIITSDKHPL